MQPQEQHWIVTDRGEPILEISSLPGPLLSTAPPPPDGRLVTHPFLSATALSASHEDELHTLLQLSANLEDFLARLRAAGYSVEEQK